MTWIAHILANPKRQETQADGCIRRWPRIEEAEGRALRVVLLPDGRTVHRTLVQNGIQAMKIRYFQDTDTLYIELRLALVSETRDLDENTVIDLDDRGTICAITIEHASERMQTLKLTTPCATACLDHQASAGHQASAYGYGRPDRPRWLSVLHRYVQAPIWRPQAPGSGQDRTLSMPKDLARRGARGLSNQDIRQITHYDRNQVVPLMLELRAENPDIRLGAAGRSARYSVDCARK